jgi:hypothetical protein
VGTIIWMSAWQLQCCGDAFGLGTEVSWRVLPPDEEWLASLLPLDTARTVTGMEEHHGDENTRPVSGTVRSIRAVCHDMAPRPGENPRVLRPVPGTTVVIEVDTADGWFETDRSEFVGYLVELA